MGGPSPHVKGVLTREFLEREYVELGQMVFLANEILCAQAYERAYHKETS